jgi:hypothetical protein
MFLDREYEKAKAGILSSHISREICLESPTNAVQECRPCPGCLEAPKVACSVGVYSLT